MGRRVRRFSVVMWRLLLLLFASYCCDRGTSEATAVAAASSTSLGQFPQRHVKAPVGNVAAAGDKNDQRVRPWMPVLGAMRGGDAAAHVQNRWVKLRSDYNAALIRRPIRTKSLTALVLFALSDVIAQYFAFLSSSPSSSLKSWRTSFQWRRFMGALFMGFVVYGPGAHYWYEFVFRLCPSSSLISTLQKVLLGQFVFGPLFTSLFLGVGLWSHHHSDVSFSSWWNKIQTDLPGLWRRGLVYWTLVSFTSFTCLPSRDWIPLFTNGASFLWTIFLSWVTHAQRTTTGAT